MIKNIFDASDNVVNTNLFVENKKVGDLHFTTMDSSIVDENNFENIYTALTSGNSNFKRLNDDEFFGNVCFNSTIFDCRINQEGVQPRKCPYLFQNSTLGNSCRQWLSFVEPEKQAVYMQNYCKTPGNENLHACKCINRFSNDDYKWMKVNNGVSDNCWFVPCAGRTTCLVYPELASQPCPSNFCTVVYNTITSNNVSLNNINTNLNCV